MFILMSLITIMLGIVTLKIAFSLFSFALKLVLSGIGTLLIVSPILFLL